MALIHLPCGVGRIHLCCFHPYRMKLGSAPGAAEPIWDLGAGGCLSSSCSVERLPLGTRGRLEHGPANVDLWAGSAWAHCYLCILWTRDTWPNSPRCGEVEVCDLILLSPPCHPWGAVPAELRRQVLAVGQCCWGDVLPCLTPGDMRAGCCLPAARAGAALGASLLARVGSALALCPQACLASGGFSSLGRSVG